MSPGTSLATGNQSSYMGPGPSPATCNQRFFYGPWTLSSYLLSAYNMSPGTYPATYNQPCYMGPGTSPATGNQSSYIGPGHSPAILSFDQPGIFSVDPLLSHMSELMDPGTSSVVISLNMWALDFLVFCHWPSFGGALNFLLLTVRHL